MAKAGRLAMVSGCLLILGGCGSGSDDDALADDDTTPDDGFNPDCVYPEESDNHCESAVACGDVNIDEPQDVVDIENCSSLTRLWVDWMSPVEVINLPCLEVIHGHFFISGQVDLHSIYLPNLTTVEGSLDWGGLSLANVEMNRLETVGEHVMLYTLHETTGFEWISSLTTVGGMLMVYRNEKLESLTGLTCLQRVEGDLEVRCNEPMTDEQAEEFAATINVGGTVTIYNNGPLSCGDDDDDDTSE